MKIRSIDANSFRTLLLGGVIPLMALGGAGAAWAQSPPSAGTAAPQAATPTRRVEEVIVTAQKRREKLQNVPIAITAVSAAQLKDSGITQLFDLGKVAPGLQVIQAVGIYSEPEMRSVGTSTHGAGIENPIATYVDGVYLVAATSGLMSLYDIDHVEVLNGPQGTLFGRNATGGLIQVITRAPTQPFHADFEETVGNVGTFNQAMYLNGGLTPTVAANLAVSHDVQSEGFGHNIYNGTWIGTFHDLNVRGKVRWTPDAETDVTLSGDYSHRAGTDVDTRALTLIGSESFNATHTALITTGIKEPGGWFDIDDNITPFEEYTGNGTSLTARHDFGPATLVSITAYRGANEYSYEDGNDLTVPNTEIIGSQTDHQFSQEFQLLSPDDQRLTWTTGLYYLNADDRANPSGKITYSLTKEDYYKEYLDNRLNSIAAFGQGTFKIDPSTNFTAGLRYSADFRVFHSSTYDNFDGTLNPNGDSQTFVGPFVEDGIFHDLKNWIRPSGKVAIDHRFSPELMVYASYNRGYRAGTFSVGNLPNLELHPETLDAFETGFKSDLLDHRLRFDAATYFYEYHNRQIQAVYNGTQFDYDAPTAQSYGVDGTVTALLTDNLSLVGGFSAIHAIYTSFPDAYLTRPNPACGPAACSSVNLINGHGDATGNWVENTPFWTVNLTPTYEFTTSAGEVTITASYFHNAGWYASPDNQIKQNPYDTVAGDVTWVPSFLPQLSLRVWGRNLTNAHYANQISESNSNDNANVAAGRTYGLTADEHF